MYNVICVTSRGLCGGDFLSRMESIAACRPKAIILREKDLNDEEYAALAEKVINICKKNNVCCILHSHIGAAEKLGAENIHLPLPVLRQMQKKEKASFKVIGSSCHSVKEALEAEKLGCSYITAGHIFSTDCKKNIPPKGIEFIKEVYAAVDIPVYAIGGIKKENISGVVYAGAAGACIMSGFMQCESVEEYLRGFVKKSFSRSTLALYAVTDRKDDDEKTFHEKIKNAVAGGATIIQLREKGMSGRELFDEAVRIKELCHSIGVPLIINDNADIALKAGADGVHVGAEDENAREIRKRAGNNFIIGVTAKTVGQAKKAEADGADYIGVGAVFPSPTKPGALRITKEQLKSICESVSIPAVAIGGIKKENIRELSGCGIAGAAVSSAVFAAKDTKKAARELKERITATAEEKNK